MNGFELQISDVEATAKPTYPHLLLPWTVIVYHACGGNK